MNVEQRLDDIAAVVENARTIPFTQTCLVQRDLIVDLADTARESLPDDVRQATAVLNERQTIIQQAEQSAEEMATRAESYARATMDSADARVAEMLEQANHEIRRMRADAEEQAQQVIADAHRRANQMVAEANDEGSRRIDAAAAQAERMVVEHEITRRAQVFALELEQHAERMATKARLEADAYVEGKLADLEETLVSSLEGVQRSRSGSQRQVDLTSGSAAFFDQSR